MSVCMHGTAMSHVYIYLTRATLDGLGFEWGGFYVPVYVPHNKYLVYTMFESISVISYKG